MQLSDQLFVPIAPPVLWDALNDPQILKECVPHCEAVERNADGSWNMQVKVRLGPVPLRLSGLIHVQGDQAPSCYELRLEGLGGVARHARCDTRVRCVAQDTAAGAGTQLQYEAELHLAGPLERFGARVLDGAARRSLAEFLKRLVDSVQRRDAALSPLSIAPPAPPPG